MNRIATLAASLMMLMAGTAQANLYKQGTELHGYVATLEKYVPAQVEVFFINRAEPAALLGQLDPAKVEDGEIQGLMTQAMDYMSAYQGKNYYVFTKSFRSSKATTSKSVCAIYTLDMTNLKDAYMHEMMHCAALASGELYGANGINQIFAPLFAESFKDSNGRAVNTGIKVAEIMEAHAHVMAEAVWKDSGIALDLSNKAKRQVAEYPISAAKTATARGIELCQSRTCPVDPSDLAKMLVNDKAFVQALRHDLSVMNTYEMAHR
jgi:sulfur relay (sulfurtransferase) DsrF/TusC family protein